MQRGKLLVPVQHLTDEPFLLDLRCSAADVELQGFIGDVTVAARIRRVDTRLFLHCDVTATAEVNCDRCAELFQATINAEYDQWYAVNAHPETIEEDTIAIALDWHSVVIDEEVRESILISVPMKKLCKDDCLGLCPTCGVNRNLAQCSCNDESENPMWAGLKKVNK
jgi:uncharacterized protein